MAGFKALLRVSVHRITEGEGREPEGERGQHTEGEVREEVVRKDSEIHIVVYSHLLRPVSEEIQLLSVS